MTSWYCFSNFFSIFLADKKFKGSQGLLVTAKCYGFDTKLSMDHSVTTHSFCRGNWTGQLKKAVKMNKVSLLYVKQYDHNISVEIKVGEHYSSCRKENKRAGGSQHVFDCYGQITDKVQIEMMGKVFDVKFNCKFTTFLLFFVNL